jgi:hypothetical protein
MEQQRGLSLASAVLARASPLSLSNSTSTPTLPSCSASGAAGAAADRITMRRVRGRRGPPPCCAASLRPRSSSQRPTPLMLPPKPEGARAAPLPLLLRRALAVARRAARALPLAAGLRGRARCCCLTEWLMAAGGQRTCPARALLLNLQKGRHRHQETQQKAAKARRRLTGRWLLPNPGFQGLPCGCMHVAACCLRLVNFVTARLAA